MYSQRHWKTAKRQPTSYGATTMPSNDPFSQNEVNLFPSKMKCFTTWLPEDKKNKNNPPFGAGLFRERNPNLERHYVLMAHVSALIFHPKNGSSGGKST